MTKLVKLRSFKWNKSSTIWPAIFISLTILSHLGIFSDQMSWDNQTHYHKKTTLQVVFNYHYNMKITLYIQLLVFPVKGNIKQSHRYIQFSTSSLIFSVSAKMIYEIKTWKTLETLHTQVLLNLVFAM